MHLSRRTVETHLSHIMAKLGVQSRLEVAREVLGQQAKDQAAS
jgi:DNA-binding CsgD family transcriptional regulator